jgi:hypothetical protein
MLSELETYVRAQSDIPDIIIDYATPGRREEPISTAIPESTGSMAATPSYERPAADALGATRRAFDAQGAVRGDERYPRTRSRSRRKQGLSSLPTRGMTPQV